MQLHFFGNLDSRCSVAATCCSSFRDLSEMICVALSLQEVPHSCHTHWKYYIPSQPHWLLEELHVLDSPIVPSLYIGCLFEKVTSAPGLANLSLWFRWEQKHSLPASLADVTSPPEFVAMLSSRLFPTTDSWRAFLADSRSTVVEQIRALHKDLTPSSTEF